MKTKLIRRIRGWQVPATLSILFTSTLVLAVQPQTTPAQFDIIGHIDSFKLNVGVGTCTTLPNSAITAPGTYNADASAGNALGCTATIVVNGQSITLPANTVITFPASFLSPYEAFAFNPLCTTSPCLNETGMAISDTQRLPNNINPATYEASIQGNVVYDAAGNASYIAGLVSISQQDLNSAEGFITDINYATGELRVGGDITNPATGARVRLNDPVGRFGRKSGPKGDNGGDTQDPRFSVDDGNPTVFAETGYPLCIPRFDPAGPTPDAECPEFNRPRSGGVIPGTAVPAHLGTYAMVTAPGVANPGRSLPAGFPAFMAGTNPMFQAPLEIGDYIVYAGTRAVDANGTYVSAHTITANLGIYTTPDTDPAYTTQEVSIVGVGVANGFVAPAEGRELFKIVGFTTDVYRGVDTGKVVVDACNGDEGFDRIVSTFPNGSAQDPTGVGLNVPLGRFRSQFLKGASLTTPMRPATKEIRVQIQGSNPPNAAGIQATSANGLTYGQYQAPVSEYIFAENLGFGGLPVVPNNFEDFQFLSLGHGPYNLYDPYGDVYGAGNPSPIQGQLAPWPGSPIPPSVNCAVGQPAPPIISINNIAVSNGVAGVLNATATVPGNPNATITSFSWALGQLPAGIKSVTAPGGGPLFPAGAASLPTLNFVANLKAGTTTAQTFNFTLDVIQTTPNFGSQTSTKLVTVTVNPAALTDTLTIPVAPTYRTKDGSWNLTVNCIANCNTSATVRFEAINGSGTIVFPSTIMSHTNGTTTWSFTGKSAITPAPATMSVRATSSSGGSVGPTSVAIRTN